MDNWELELLTKMDNKEKLTESEISDLVYECEIEVKYGQNRRGRQNYRSSFTKN